MMALQQGSLVTATRLDELCVQGWQLSDSDKKLNIAQKHTEALWRATLGCLELNGCKSYVRL